MFKRKSRKIQAQRKLAGAPKTRLRWRKSYNWVFLLLPLAFAADWVWRLDAIMPIRSIQLAGSFEYLDQTEVEALLRPYIGQGFFSLDIGSLQQSLHSKPWAESVSVRRVWPDKLKVLVVEKRPLARWDDEHLLSDQAVVFAADTAGFAHLPLLHAVNHPPTWLLARYRELADRFAAVDEQIVALRVDSRGAFDVELINGLEVRLGRSDVERKITRLVSIYDDQILPRREQIRRLDLRYSNGFAVTWKPDLLRGSDKASLWSNSNV